MFVLLQGGLYPCKDLAITVNLGEGASCQLQHSFHGDSAQWVGAGDGLAAKVVTVGFECPMPWATVNVPLAWDLQLLLWLLSLQFPWLGHASSVGLDRVIICQLDGGLSSSTSMSVKVAKGCMTWHSPCALSANWWGSPRYGGWSFSAQYCRALAYTKVFCGCHMQ